MWTESILAFLKHVDFGLTWFSVHDKSRGVYRSVARAGIEEGLLHWGADSGMVSTKEKTVA